MSEPSDTGPEPRPAGGSPAGAAPAGSTTPTEPPRRGLTIRPVNWLLLIPLVGTLIPEVYNRRNPSIGGMPFFYWYQMVWVAISVSITYYVYVSTRGDR